MTRPNKREQLAAMRLEDFKAHLRTIAGGLRNKSAAHQAESIAGAQSQEGGANTKTQEALSVIASVYRRRTDLQGLRCMGDSSRVETRYC